MTRFALSVALALIIWAVAWSLRSVRARQTGLLLASYLFYSSWGVGFLAILIVSSVSNYFLGSLLRRHLRVSYLWLGVALNVGLLGVFKYLPTLLAMDGSGWESELARHILMPVGISFWTFQALSYLIDIYLEEEDDPSLLEFCLYMAFWPTVLSGPVCRLTAMLPQFRRQPIFLWDDLSQGALQILQGLFMKMYLAQMLAGGWVPGGGVTAGFDQVKSGWGGIDVWLLGIGFAFQLFFDFGGYSLMVIGVARVFGIKVAENFNRPFLSTTPAIFWTRWHMSLSFWIRDYVFKPLAVARRERWWQYVALVISMTIFGVWHGAKWTYVVFGVYHGVLLVLHRIGHATKPRVRLPKGLGMALSWGATFSLIALGYILFRANDLPHALSMLGSVVSPSAYGRFALPPGFYVLTLTMASGYFLFTGASFLAASWRARYREVVGHDRPSIAGGLWPVRVSSIPVSAGGLLEWLATSVWWWLAPAVVSLAGFIGLAVYTQRFAIPVTPFIYTLF